jgi:hypothetical protein
VSAPALVLAGETSSAWAHKAARAIADLVPAGEAKVLAGQGHLIADDVLIAVLREFFSRQPTS